MPPITIMTQKELNPIHFEKASVHHLDTILGWLAEPHMVAWWDNSEDHKNDILNFVHRRKQHYFYGTTCYWIGLLNNIPFAFLLSDVLHPEQDLPPLYHQHLNPTARTITLDFGIGNPDFLGQGLASPTLQAFTDFYQKQVDPLAKTFFIDPVVSHAHARHVYAKAGFQEVGTYEVTIGNFKGHHGCLMVKN